MTHRYLISRVLEECESQLRARYQDLLVPRERNSRVPVKRSREKRLPMLQHHTALAKAVKAKMFSGASLRSPAQTALELLVLVGSCFWSYCNMMNERIVTFELRANIERLQEEVRQQQGQYDGHGHEKLELQAAFEGLRTNFEMLRTTVQKHRKWLDTQQLELAQLQTQYLPNQEGGVPSAAKAAVNRSRTQTEPVSTYEASSYFRDTSTTSEPRPTNKRKLSQDTADDRALIRVDAPDGFSQFIMGAESAADNVIMEKQHLDDGGEFMLSRNETQALGIDVDGGVTIHSDPLNVASTVQAISGNRLTMRSTETIHMQTVMSHTVSEIDGQGTWSSAELKINVGDTVKWTWTNYHNVIETDEAGVIKGRGQTSGTPAIASSFELAFNEPGTYRFKSQTYLTMTCVITVVDSFKFEEGSLTLRSLSTQSLTVEQDFEVAGSIREGAAVAAHEIKLFLGSECPPGWVEATELGGYMLMGRPAGGEVNTTKNRPMNSTEQGRTHGVYFKGTDRFTSVWGSNERPSGYDAPSAFSTQSYNDYFYFDKLSNPSYQTASNLQHVGEYYPFASVLICKAA